MNAIKNGVNGTNPKNFPSTVNGTRIAMIHIATVKKYTVPDALLWINGIFAVLIIWSPIKFDMIP